MKNRTTVESLVFGGLLVSGTVLRWQLQDVPNFAPVAALALFAGFFFRSVIVAAALPLAIMSISDYFIGGYETRLMLLVYGALTMPVLFRGAIRKWLAARDASASIKFAGCVSASLAASFAFFVLTNLGVFVWSDMYEPTFGGLLRCYVNALPFFRNTLAGDLFFGCLLFGTHAVVVHSPLSRRIASLFAVV